MHNLDLTFNIRLNSPVYYQDDIQLNRLSLELFSKEISEAMIEEIGREVLVYP